MTASEDGMTASHDERTTFSPGSPLPKMECPVTSEKCLVRRLESHVSVAGHDVVSVASRVSRVADDVSEVGWRSAACEMLDATCGTRGLVVEIPHSECKTRDSDG